jgi:hypothetical protein
MKITLVTNRALFMLGMGALLSLTTPAQAQDSEPQFNPGAASAGERITQVIVYGDDPCKTGTGDEIVVCVRQAEKERYRIPPNLRNDPLDPKNQAWINRAQSIEYVGRSGAQSCSTAGAGGFSGCFAKIAADAKAERKQQDATSWADLVAAERAKRLGNLDAESDAIETRVKAEEAAEAAKQALPVATTPATTPVPTVPKKKPVTKGSKKKKSRK